MPPPRTGADPAASAFSSPGHGSPGHGSPGQSPPGHGSGVHASAPSASALPASALPGSDEKFQELLLGLAAKAGERPDAGALIQFFCRATREFFQVAGVYFWRCQSADDLIGQQGDGKLVEEIVGLRLRAGESAVTAEAVRRQRTTLAN